MKPIAIWGNISLAGQPALDWVLPAPVPQVQVDGQSRVPQVQVCSPGFLPAAISEVVNSGV